MNKTNYWFTFYERFPLRSKIPDIIYFIIHNGQLSDQEQRDYKSRVDRIKDISSHFGITARSMSSILEKITPQNSRYVYENITNYLHISVKMKVKLRIVQPITDRLCKI